MAMPDNYPISNEEALTFLCHHLRLAAMYFEVCDDSELGTKRIRSRIGELFSRDGYDMGRDAALAWLTAIEEQYQSFEDQST